MSLSGKLRRIFCILLPLSFLCSYGYSQTMASLLKKWDKARADKDYRQKSGNIPLVLKIADHYRYTYPDSSLMYARVALDLSKAQNSVESEKKALNSIAKVYYIKGEYNLSMEASSRVLLLSAGENSNIIVADAINNMGLVLLGQTKYHDAIPEFRKAAQLNQRFKNRSSLAANYINLGICFDETSKPDSALFYLRKAVGFALETSNANMRDMAFNRIGHTYFNAGNYTEAIDYYEEVIKITKNNWERSFANIGLAKVYYQQEQYKAAIRHATTGLYMANKMNVKWDASEASKVLSEAYAKTGDFRNAYYFSRLNKRYDDSLMSEAKEKEINYLNLKRKMAENQQLVRDNKLKNQEIKLNELIFILIGVAALFIVVFIAYIIRSNRKQKLLNLRLNKKNKDIELQKDKIEQQNKELSRLNYTKDQLFYILSHDLRAPLASVQQASELLCDECFSPGEQKIIVEGFYREITSVYNMLNNMLYWAASQQKGIKANRSLIDLSAISHELLDVYEIVARNKGISLINEQKLPVWVNADPDQVKVIIQNLVGNAIKFTNTGGLVRLFFDEDELYYKLHVKDTGVGITEEKIERLFTAVGKSISTYGTNSETGTGLGLVLVKEFTGANGGNLEVRSSHGEGSEFIVSFQKKLDYVLNEDYDHDE
ncbi:signal transduction histidine kinase [Arcticibacter tournemirensis]|nr:signal transduction histidine kinase [Arcticibacter tournemirensis]